MTNDPVTHVHSHLADALMRGWQQAAVRERLCDLLEPGIAGRNEEFTDALTALLAQLADDPEPVIEILSASLCVNVGLIAGLAPEYANDKLRVLNELVRRSAPGPSLLG